MGFFQSKKRQPREPSETARLTPNVEAMLWTAKGEKGDLKVSIGFNRLDEEGTQRRTFRPEHLSQLAASIGILAQSLGTAHGIDRVTADELTQLGAALANALQTMKANGQSYERREPGETRLLG